MSTKTVPIFLGEGKDQIQIGEALVDEWAREPGYTQIMMDIDVFPGERICAARIVKWDEVLVNSKWRYTKEG